MFARMRPCISVAAIGMICVVSTESLRSEVKEHKNPKIGDVKYNRKQKNLRICKEHGIKRVR